MRTLSEEEINAFLQDGVLVVDDVLSPHEADDALSSLEETLKKHGVHSLSAEDESSARAFSTLSSTNGSGGVLDLFYEPWKLSIATNETLFKMTQQLWATAYCHEGESRDSLPDDEVYRWHPYEKFDTDRGYAYLDRVGYRLPTQLAQDIGDRINPERKKKARSLQRSLTPHLDCCPDTLYDDAVKWRPIQCFVSLTENLEKNTGGFEAARGFHREFEEWRKHRKPTQVRQKGATGTVAEVCVPAPCIGQYTHIRPKEDREVMERVAHVPVRKGSAVFWDNRTPHANAYRHTGRHPRAVVYCSFLPDVELNRRYVKKQLEDFLQGKPPRDQWNQMDQNRIDDNKAMFQNYAITPLGRKLLGMDAWDK